MQRFGEGLAALRTGALVGTAMGWRFGPVGTVRQMQGLARPAAAEPPPPGTVLRPTEAADLAALATLDHAATGFERARLLAAMLADGSGVLLKCRGTITGFALRRRFGRGAVIGPVTALDAAAARVLIDALLAPHPGRFVRLDIPLESGLAPWLETRGLASAGDVVRMVRGTIARSGHCFTLAGQSLG